MEVPYFTTINNNKIPAIGFGTFGSDHVSNKEMMESVRLAIKAGYRHIDCASVYGNEKEIGIVLKEAMDGKLTKNKIPREEFWITSKLWNDKHKKEDIRQSFMKSLRDLGLDYLDLYLVHWPFPNYHPPGCDVSSRSPDAKPYIHKDFMILWREFEKLKQEGLVKEIGVSNVTIPKLNKILPDCKIKPSVIEMEMHPHFQQKELRDYAIKNNMTIIGFSPLGSPNRPDRDKTSTDTVDLEDPVVLDIAKAHNTHPALICLKWAHSNNVIPIPFSTKEKNIISNLKSVCEDPLSEAELKKLNKIDKNCRLIKGHVFLWEGAKDWHDLWDEKGFIVS
ncbi:MAG: aldo/keto reductase [Sphaerochaetaceae bacterium]|nr:aldo/keto reductase [Sphaerochaetaceae bacterium]MDC7249626.1 aldo/keto reductase [Sphaerochaetaceae bacterium]